MNEKANQLANELKLRGVEREKIVAICMDRSFELVIAMLAIFKAGGAYLPLDPTYPIERLRYMLEDAKPMLIVTFDNTVNLFSVTNSIMNITAESHRLAQHPISFESATSSSDQLAYVMYTSGSTGEPKGVMIEHRSIYNELSSRSIYGLDETDRILFKAPISFDASVVEIFWPLQIGARLIIAKPNGQRDPDYLVRLIKEQQVTTIHFVPSMLDVFLEEQQVSQCTSLRRVFSGGEKLTYELQQKLFAKLNVDLINRYGPTEATINATAWKCQREDLKWHDVPIGRPIANVQAYVLDRYDQPVPIGVIGELYLGGAGIARGYLHRPALTEQKFIPHPFVNDDSDQRLYKTGDLVKYRSDGEIEFVGRVDQQIKLRGIRIELGEITSVMLQFPYVDHAIVLVNEQKLVAFVISHPPITFEQLKYDLKQKLPAHMIPSVITFIEELPLTPSGKVDHLSLLQMENHKQPSMELKIIARDETERKLVQIWEQMLNTSNIGVTDRFFHIGGHSLIAIRLVNEIEIHFNYKFPLALLFLDDTIEQMAVHIKSGKGSEQVDRLVPIQENGSRSPLFLVHPIGGHVLHYYPLAREFGEDQPLYGFQALGLGDDQEPLKRIESLAELYIQEMRKVQSVGPYHLGGWSFGGIVAYEMGQQLQKQGEKVTLILLDSKAPVAGDDQASDDLANFAYDLANRYGRVLSKQTIQSYTQLRNDTERIDYIMKQLEDQLGAYGITKKNIDESFQVYQAHLHARRAYGAKPFDGSLLLIRASDEQRDDLDDTLGWDKLVQGSIEFISQPGNHYSIFQAPQVEEVAKHIMNYIDKMNEII